MINTTKNYSRKDFLKLSSCSALAVTLSGIAGCVSQNSSKHIPLGMQLYSVRQELAEDFEGTISKLSGMGYEGVEFANYFDYSASELKTILADNGLVCCGSHVRIGDLRGDSLKETIDFNLALENKYLILRWIPQEDRVNHETFLRTVEEYNRISEQIKPYDLRLGYHNHDYIFETFNGEMLWDILATNTGDDFILQLDTGHAAGIGQDPVELIKRHPNRTVSMHAKAYSSENEAAVIGDDELNWEEIVLAAESTGGIEWYILEYEIEGVPPLQALESSLQNFKDLRTKVTA